MIICPNCHHKEFPGALFCSDCGTQLVPLDVLHTRTIGKTNIEPASSVDQASGLNSIKMNLKNAAPGISIHIVDSGQVLHLSDRLDFTLGRAIEGQPILPDVDLSPYNAFSMGVSRLHAALRIINGDVYISDLGSSNGTRVNGQRIVPHVDCAVNHGDLIVLGKLKMQILVIK